MFVIPLRDKQIIKKRIQILLAQKNIHQNKNYILK